MATKEEETFIEKYASFLDAVPCKIKRILIVYNVSRYIVGKDPTINSSKFLEKLFQYTASIKHPGWFIFLNEVHAQSKRAEGKMEVNLSIRC